MVEAPKPYATWWDARARRGRNRGERRERRDGNRTVIQEGNRTIVREGNRTIIRRDETDHGPRAPAGPHELPGGAGVTGRSAGAPSTRSRAPQN